MRRSSRSTEADARRGLTACSDLARRRGLTAGAQLTGRFSFAGRSAPALRAALGDRGSASLEFLVLGVLLLVPLAYLALSLASIQSAALCAEGAARNAGRLLADDAASPESLEQAETAIAFAVADHGLDLDATRVEVTCLPEGSRCAGDTALVSVRVTVLAPLPLIPAALDPSGRASIPVSATSAFPVGRFSAGSP